MGGCRILQALHLHEQAVFPNTQEKIVYWFENTNTTEKYYLSLPCYRPIIQLQVHTEIGLEIGPKGPKLFVFMLASITFQLS